MIHEELSFDMLPTVNGLDLGSRAHTVRLITFFVPCTKGGDEELKARFFRGKQEEGRECICPP